METEQCTLDTNIKPDGLPLTFVQKSVCSRRKVPIPSNTLLIAVGARTTYLETLHYLKQLELNGLAERADYYPNPFVLFAHGMPTTLKREWLRSHIGKIYDPSTGETRYRTTHDFALWAIAANNLES